MERLLKPDPTYDMATQRLLGLWAAQLDDQLDILEHVVAGLTPAELEWQPRPGVNTIGMLLAHLAIVEVSWLQWVAIGCGDHGEEEIRQTLGIGMSDDGMPLAADGGHPAVLQGKNREEYLALLHTARRATHERLLSWRDDELEEKVSIRGNTVSLAWIVYHVLEHFACHLGQIRVLRRDLPKE